MYRYDRPFPSFFIPLLLVAVILVALLFPPKLPYAGLGFLDIIDLLANGASLIAWVGVFLILLLLAVAFLGNWPSRLLFLMLVFLSLFFELLFYPGELVAGWLKDQGVLSWLTAPIENNFFFMILNLLTGGLAQQAVDQAVFYMVAFWINVLIYLLLSKVLAG